MFRFLSKKTFGTSATRFLNDPILEKLGIRNKHLLRNLSVPELYENGCNKSQPANPDTRPTVIGSTGAMCAYSGTRMGRSPKDKRVVLDKNTEKEIWWGEVNIPQPPETYRLLEDIAINYLNTRPRLYVTDGYLGWDPKYRIKCRVLTSRAYHALFMRNMMIVPTEEELKKDFALGADYYIFNAGEYAAPTQKWIPGLGPNKCCVSVNLSERRMTVLGSQYGGEMKKGLFGVMHYLMPKKGVVSLHASANEGPKGDTTLLFGLSGTGKTTLSADVKRRLIGDDEHCWTPEGIFNIEGGCYAKCIGLTEEKEPEIYNALKFGSVLENVMFYDDHNRVVNYHDISLTENTRASYPLEFIPGAKLPAVGGHPKNIIFLTCDAFGVLPPVAKLTPEQAMYHFIAGYTAKVAGTEVGIIDPVPTFSACFGAAFLPLHPTIYAEMLADKMKQFKCNAWLINTGWTGGKYGVGKRMNLKLTRAIIDSIHDDVLDKIPTKPSPLFGLHIPESCPGVPTEILDPKNTWQDKAAYDATLKTLAKSFVDNFKTFADKASDAIRNAGPKL